MKELTWAQFYETTIKYCGTTSMPEYFKYKSKFVLVENSHHKLG